MLYSLNRDDNFYDPELLMRDMQSEIDREMELESEGGWLQVITDSIERRKAMVSAGALAAQQLNGIQLFYYSGTVFSKAIGLEDHFMMTLIVFIMLVFVVQAAVVFANRIPQRPLLMVTTGAMTVSISS